VKQRYSGGLAGICNIDCDFINYIIDWLNKWVKWVNIRNQITMNSTMGHVGTLKKPKTVIKGIIRRGKKKNLLIIIENDVYFVTINALKKVMDGIEETTPILGY